jgi:poly(3-hydroxybutyrate) depolymerase
MSKNIVSSSFLCGSLALCLAVGLGCSSDNSGQGGSSSSASAGSTGSSVSSAGGGSSSAGASVSSAGGGGASAQSSSSASGGKSSAGGSTKIDSTASGGKSMTSTGTGGGGGGGTATGGTTNDGSTATGGSSKIGGTTGLGGAGGSGGATSKTGGTSGGGTSATATGGTATGGTGGSTGATGGAKTSDGCGKTPSKFKSATVGQASPVNSISVGNKNREFLVRWPSNYKNDTPYRLHLGLHGYGGNLAENGRDNFGLWSLSKDTTIFVTLAAVGGSWDFTGDLAYVDEVVKQVESEFCIDTSRVMLEGFSQGGGMSWVLTCSRPGVYRAVVGHSAGSPNFTPPTNCSPVAYLGSLGLTDIEGNSQATQTDRFAKANGCTMEDLPTAPKGGHICTPYKGCPAAFPVIWCSYDGGHGFTPTDSGKSTTWVPQTVWDFLSPL